MGKTQSALPNSEDGIRNSEDGLAHGERLKGKRTISSKLKANRGSQRKFLVTFNSCGIIQAAELRGLVPILQAERTIWASDRKVSGHSGYPGGYGYTKDYPLEKMMRNAQLNQILGGTNHSYQLAIAQS